LNGLSRKISQERLVEKGYDVSVDYRLDSPQKTGQTRQPPTDVKCDNKIAAIFGGSGAKAATVYEPPGVNVGPGGERYRYGHLAGSGAFHIYTNAQGSEATVGLYAPPEWIGTPRRRVETDRYTGEKQSYFSFRYRRGLTLNFVHVGGTDADDNLVMDRNDRNGMGSIRIGIIAGPGGEGNGYNHSHITVRVNGVRTDPRKVFCK
jgi:hypothetical protein